MDRIKFHYKRLPTPVRRTIIFIAGWTVAAVGVLLLVLPGPGWLLIFFGLAILATEFAYAARLRNSVVHRVKQTVSKVSKGKFKLVL